MSDTAKLIGIGAVGLGALYLLNQRQSLGGAPGQGDEAGGPGGGGGLGPGGLLGEPSVGQLGDIYNFFGPEPSADTGPGPETFATTDGGGSSPLFPGAEDFFNRNFATFAIGGPLAAYGAKKGYDAYKAKRAPDAGDANRQRSTNRNIADAEPAGARKSSPVPDAPSSSVEGGTSRTTTPANTEASTSGRSRPGTAPKTAAKAPDVPNAPRAPTKAGVVRGAGIGVGLEALAAAASLPGAVDASQQLQRQGLSNRAASGLATAAAFGGFDAVSQQSRVQAIGDKYAANAPKNAVGNAFYNLGVGTIQTADTIRVGAVGTVKGTAQAITQPVQTVKAVGKGLKLAGKGIRGLFR